MSPTQFLKPFPKGRALKVGVYYGTFDPVHEGHVATAKEAARFAGLDTVIFVPNRSTPHKRSASELDTRLQMLKIRLAKESRANLLVDDGGLIVRSGREAFMTALLQMFGSTQVELYQIIGADSYKSQVSSRKIHKDLAWKVLVMPRDDEPIRISPALATVVQKLDVAPGELSSTKIRNAIRAGQPVSETILDRDVMAYVVAHGLYGAKPQN